MTNIADALQDAFGLFIILLLIAVFDPVIWKIAASEHSNYALLIATVFSAIEIIDIIGMFFYIKSKFSIGD